MLAENDKKDLILNFAAENDSKDLSYFQHRFNFFKDLVFRARELSFSNEHNIQLKKIGLLQEFNKLYDPDGDDDYIAALKWIENNFDADPSVFTPDDQGLAKNYLVDKFMYARGHHTGFSTYTSKQMSSTILGGGLLSTAFMALSIPADDQNFVAAGLASYLGTAVAVYLKIWKDIKYTRKAEQRAEDALDFLYASDAAANDSLEIA